MSKKSKTNKKNWEIKSIKYREGKCKIFYTNNRHSIVHVHTLDNPKSAIFKSSKFSPHSIFSGLRSLCTIPKSCKYATDSSRGRISLAASNSVNLSATKKKKKNR